MKELKGAGAYTRGWESFSHFITMFKTALGRQILVCLLLGASYATWSMSAELPAGGTQLVRYANASFTAAYAAKAPSVVKAVSGTNAEARQHYQRLHSGRTFSFIVQQFVLRLLACAFLAMPVIAWAMTAFGRKLGSDSHRRGAKLVDATTWLHRKKDQILLIKRGLCAAAVGAIAFAGLILGSRVLAFPDLLVASLAANVPPFSRLVSPGFQGETIWHRIGDDYGFATASASTKFIVTWMGLESLPDGLLLICQGAVLGALCFAIFALLRKPKPTGALTLGNVEIPRKLETSHFLLAGTTGAGKTQAARTLFDAIRRRGQRAIVFDTKGDYITRYYRPGKDIILNPLDARSAPWTVWNEIEELSDYTTLGKALFPESPGKDPFWAAGGSAIFASLAERIHDIAQEEGRQPTNSEFAYILNNATVHEFAEILSGMKGARFVDPDAEQTASNFLSTVMTRLGAFEHLPDADDDQFSINKWVQKPEDDDSWLFISMRAKDEGVLLPLVSLWYDIAVRAVLGLPEVDQSKPEAHQHRLFFLLDELGRLNNLPSLDPMLREGRSRGASILLGIQSLAQIEAAYGQAVAKSILGQPQTRIILRTPDGTTAHWLENELGKAELLRSTESQQMGANAERDGVNLQRQIVQESIVLASEIQKLEPLSGYLKVGSEPVARISFPFIPSSGDLSPFERAAQLPPATPPRWYVLLQDRVRNRAKTRSRDKTGAREC